MCRFHLTRSMVIATIALAVCLSGARADDGLFDENAPAATTPPGGGAVAAPAAGADALARDVLNKANAVCFTLNNAYIVTALASYSVDEAGTACGNISVMWDPYNGVRAKYNGKLQTMSLAVSDVEMLAKVAWSEALFAEYSYAKQTAAQTPEGFNVTDQRDEAAAVSAYDAEYFRTGQRLLDAHGQTGMEIARVGQKADGKFYVKEVNLLVNDSGLRCQYVMTYTHQDDLVILKRISMTLKSDNPRLAANGPLQLTLDKAQFLKITNTGKGLMQDRVDAFVALTVSMDLRKPERDKRLGAAKVLGKVGVHAVPYIPLLDEVARSDADAEVRQAAAATAAQLRALPPAAGAVTAAPPGAAAPPAAAGATPPAPAGVVPPANTDSARFVGSWRGSFTLAGVAYVENIQFLANGGVRSVVTSQNRGDVMLNRRGTYSADNGVLTVNYVGERSGSCQYQFDSENQIKVTVAGMEIQYTRVGP